MKYIRTDDGIKRVFRKLKDGFYLVKVSKYKYYHYYPDCKVANTIEELCDEFVMLRLKDELNDNEPIIFKHLDLAKSYFEKYLGYAIYGAIWTDKGLIYVAKMNEKGEWELL